MKITATLLILLSSVSSFAMCKSGVEKGIAYFSQVESCNGAGTKYVSYKRSLCQTFDRQYHYEYVKQSETMCR